MIVNIAPKSLLYIFSLQFSFFIPYKMFVEEIWLVGYLVDVPTICFADCVPVMLSFHILNKR